MFVQIAQLVDELAGQKFDLKPLIKSGQDGLSVGLQSGKETVLSGEVEPCKRLLVHTAQLVAPT